MRSDSKRRLFGAIVLMATIAVSSAVFGATAEQSFQAGKQQLAARDLNAALRHFAAAAQADPGNREYVQQYALVRQVIAMRAALPEENDPQRWEYLARGLHAFYISHGMYADALEIDTRLHRRLDSAMSALILAETQLAMNRVAEAVQVMEQLPEEKHTAASRAVQGIALVRQGELDAARKLAGAIELPDPAGPGTIYAVARLNGAVGKADAACGLLVRCLESTVPSQQAAFKAHAQACPEFAALAGQPQFTAALATESKISESACSGGTSCANCPMRGQCSGGQ